MSLYLGVDGGGTKTEFVLIDESGRILGMHREGSAYHLETGMDALQSMLATGLKATLQRAGASAAQVDFAFFGLPTHGEDSALLPRLDCIADVSLSAARYRCGNDMVCGWAGALAGRDGINLVSGTGSIVYGECAGRTARAGGWGELFGDEGSAFMLAREALTLFSRMSDGRLRKGPIYSLIRERFQLHRDLDLCAAVYGPPALSRSELAGLAPLVAQAAAAGDVQAQQLFEDAAQQLALMVHAVRHSLQAKSETPLQVSYSGGMFQLGELLLRPLRSALHASGYEYQVVAPRMTPGAGAALYAAKLAGMPLPVAAIEELARQSAPAPSANSAA